MSKPEKAVELDTPSDLLSASNVSFLKHAEELVMEEVRKWPSLMRVHWVLKIPPQIFDEAEVLAGIKDCSLQVEFTYDSDEWSFMALGFNKDGTDIRQFEVWSPGA